MAVVVPAMRFLRPANLPRETYEASYQERISFMDYVAMVVARLPFKDDAPLQIIEKLSRFLNNQGHSVYSSLEKVFGEGGSEVNLGTNTMDDVRLQCEAAMAVAVVQATKLHLQRSYGLTETRFQEWRTNKKSHNLAYKRAPLLIRS